MKKKVIAFGVGKYLTNNIKELEKEYDIVKLCDNDPNKWNKTFMGYVCISPESEELEKYEVIITVEKPKMRWEIFNQIKDKAIIRSIYEDMVPMPKDGIKRNIFEGRERRIYLFGAVDACRLLEQMVYNCCNDIKIEGYISPSIHNLGVDALTGRKIISTALAEDLLQKGDIDGILVEGKSMSAVEIARRYLSDKVLQGEQCFYCSRIIFSRKQIAESDIIRIFTPFKNSYNVCTVQFLITKKCNLNCKLCSHFAALEKETRFYEYDQYVKDLERVSELLDEVDEIGLWGGEPLLCPELDRYIYAARDKFPNARLAIGTNGLLVDKISKKVIYAIKETDTILAISLYPVTLKRIDKIKSFLDAEGIKVRYPNTTKIESFHRRYELEGKNDYIDAYKRCNSRACTTVYEGRMGACYFPIVANIFNECFDEKFYVDEDVVDLYDKSLTKDKLITYLRTPMKACRYCGCIQMEEWGIASKDPRLEDWVKDKK